MTEPHPAAKSHLILASSSKSPTDSMAEDDVVELHIAAISTSRYSRQATALHMTQILTGTVTAIIESINELRSEVNVLRQEGALKEAQITTLRQEIMDLKNVHSRPIGTTFTPFPRLPIEIRRMIWGEALKVPQLIGIQNVIWSQTQNHKAFKVPTAAHSRLVKVNNEARTEALKVLVLYSESFGDATAPPIYANLNIDTIWMVMGDQKYSILDFTAFGYPCEIYDHFWPDKSKYLGSIAVPRGVQVTNLALSCELWQRILGHREETSAYLIFMIGLHREGVKNLVIILGSEEASKHSDTVLVKPGQKPLAMLPVDWAKEHGVTRHTAWDEVEEAMTEEYLKIKADGAADREEMILHSQSQLPSHKPLLRESSCNSCRRLSSQDDCNEYASGFRIGKRLYVRIRLGTSDISGSFNIRQIPYYESVLLNDYGAVLTYGIVILSLLVRKHAMLIPAVAAATFPGCVVSMRKRGICHSFMK